MKKKHDLHAGRLLKNTYKLLKLLSVDQLVRYKDLQITRKARSPTSAGLPPRFHFKRCCYLFLRRTCTSGSRNRSPACWWRARPQEELIGWRWRTPVHVPHDDSQRTRRRRWAQPARCNLRRSTRWVLPTCECSCRAASRKVESGNEHEWSQTITSVRHHVGPLSKTSTGKCSWVRTTTGLNLSKSSTLTRFNRHLTFWLRRLPTWAEHHSWKESYPYRLLWQVIKPAFICWTNYKLSVWLAQIVKHLPVRCMFTQAFGRSGFNPRSRQSWHRIPSLRG